MRGNPATSAREMTEMGSSPACAGEPVILSFSPRLIRVYPRVCGGTGHGTGNGGAERGLSPRVRGNQSLINTGKMRDRSIPACAGEPKLRRDCPLVPGVYPRVCGGTLLLAFHQQLIEGLSPRVRGNLHACFNGACFQRSIPACAGEPDEDIDT